MQQQQLLNLKNQALAMINDAKDQEELNRLRIAYLGRKGKINDILKELPSLKSEQKAKIGQLVNEVKKTIEKAIRRQQSATSGRRQTADGKFFDVTLPGEKLPQGHLHLVTQAIEEITEIFKQIGFVRVRYPEVDWEWYLFESLNMPKDHPARDEWETFFVDTPDDDKKGKMALSVHTSNGQVREMERVEGKPPIRMLNIAKCYRRQQDVTHTSMFHQFEGLVVDKGINITHLKGVLDYFASCWFGSKVKSRIRPFHFQFTEPSFEVDITCGICFGTGFINGNKCRICKSGWLELGGAGMVHPNVLKAGGIDPDIYSGFAYGWGIERCIMMRPEIGLAEIRLLYSGDIRFLEQF